MEDPYEDLKYPIGRYVQPAAISVEDREHMINELEALPDSLRELVESLSADDLARTYRPGSWTVRQIIHHIADSHANSYTRLKLALTEECPTIRPYDENTWAALKDASEGDIEMSLNLVAALHTRMVATYRNMSDADFERTWYHPQSDLTRTIAHLLALYTWHGKHHLEQIRTAIEFYEVD